MLPNAPMIPTNEIPERTPFDNPFTTPEDVAKSLSGTVIRCRTRETDDFDADLVKAAIQFLRAPKPEPVKPEPAKPREWQGSGKPPAWWGYNLAEKLAMAQADMQQPPKLGTMPRYNYETQKKETVPYVTNDDLCQVVRPALARWGVTLLVEMEPFGTGENARPFLTRERQTAKGKTQVLFTVKLRFTFTDGNEAYSAIWMGEGAELPIAMTYCEKYYLAKRFLLGGGDADDEGQTKLGKPAKPPTEAPAVKLAEEKAKPKRKPRSKKKAEPKAEDLPPPPGDGQAPPPKTDQAAPEPKKPSPPKSAGHPMKHRLWTLIHEVDGVFDDGKIDMQMTRANANARIASWLLNDPDLCAKDAKGRPCLEECDPSHLARLVAKYKAISAPTPDQEVPH